MDLSIIVQGPMHERLLKSIPNYMRYGKVILSTWSPHDTEKEIYAKVKKLNIGIITQKPREYDWFNRGNIYRQTSTVLAGLKLVQTDWVIKVRTDCYYHNLSPIIEKLCEDKLVCSEFHFGSHKLKISDYIIAGKTSDIFKMFELVRVFCEYTPKEKHGGYPDPKWFNLDFPCPTESILFACYLRGKHIWPDSDNSPELLRRHATVVFDKELSPYIMVSNGLRDTRKSEGFDEFWV